MEPTLTWLDFTARDRDQMRRVIDLFSEQGTVDELGLGSLRDTFSNTLFPGTSTIQTRLRYALFVPWMYKKLEGKRLDSAEFNKRARRAELNLIAPLIENEDNEGVIGARAKRTLSRLPSSVYWASLVQWGIFKPGQSQSWYHNNFDSLSRAKDEPPHADDPGVVWSRPATWHERLPSAPDEFPGTAGFELTRREAEFVQGRILETCHGSLLAWLAQEGSSDPAEYFWDDAVTLRARESIRDVVELARRFSLHVEGGPLVYNLMLAQKRAAIERSEREQTAEEGSSDEELVETYRGELEKWGTEAQEAGPLPIDALWRFMAEQGTPVNHFQKLFVDTWTRRIEAIEPSALADDAGLRQLIGQREIQLKGHRARLENDGRLLDWSGSVGLGRMGFRWFRVHQLLIDLHRGLGR